MSLIKSIVATVCMFLCGTLSVPAQQMSYSPKDTYYNSSLHNESIFNGREYRRYPFFINEGLPYYKTNSLTSGEVEFEGITYEKVPLLYDDLADELITRNFSGEHLIRLVKQKVSRFILFNDTFINISAARNISPGYYQVIYNGISKLLRKESKQIVEDIKSDNVLRKKVQVKVKLFLKRGEEYYSINNTGAAVAILDKNSKELKDFVKSNRRRHKQIGIGEALIEVLRYYEQLTP